MLPKNLRQDAGDSRQDGGSPHPAIEGREDRMIFSATVIKGPIIVGWALKAVTKTIEAQRHPGLSRCRLCQKQGQ
jgi:hypothetical protein